MAIIVSFVVPSIKSENSSLPVIVTMSFEKNGRTYTGCTAESAARTLTALGADAIGVNCSLGPDMLDIHTPRERMNVASVARTWDLLKEILRRAKEL